MRQFLLLRIAELKGKVFFRDLSICLLFVGSVLTVQMYPSYLYMMILVSSLISFIFIFPNYKTTALTCCAFIGGFAVFELLEQPLMVWMIGHDFPQEIAVIVGRVLVCCYIVFLLLAALIDHKNPMNYWRIGNFRERISFPWIWKGFDHPPIWMFIIIFSLITSVMFIVTIFAVKPDSTLSIQLVMYSLLFACINAPLEEIMWRGLILSRFVDTMGTVPALIVTSVGFGFYHYALGIPLIGCIGFALGSIYMAGLTLRSNGLLPVVIFHFVLNFWMFMSGAITH
jgi:membrane protease YdiL (CAAX protease family)